MPEPLSASSIYPGRRPEETSGRSRHAKTSPAGRARPLPKASCRRPFPDRALHVVDIENLAGAAVPSLAQVSQVQARYLTCPGFGAGDQVVLAASHLALLNAGLGWPHARYRVRSGKDGADLELLDVLEHENVAARFSRVVIGSGDGMFGQAAAGLAARGVRVTVVSRRGSLAHDLARAALDVIYLDRLLLSPSRDRPGASGQGTQRDRRQARPTLPAQRSRLRQRAHSRTGPSPRALAAGRRFPAWP